MTVRDCACSIDDDGAKDLVAATRLRLIGEPGLSMVAQ
jgi:hypothetical protein